MREIKFKQWLDGQWHFWGKVNGERFVFPASSSSGENPNTSIHCEFTGLKDKNGVDIYEGDWLKDDCGDLFIVKFGKLPLDKSGDCVCTFPAFYAEARDPLQASHLCNQIGEWMIVIGNIYENPELLKQGAEG